MKRLVSIPSFVIVLAIAAGLGNRLRLLPQWRPADAIYSGGDIVTVNDRHRRPRPLP